MSKVDLILLCLVCYGVAEVVITSPQQLQHSFSAPLILSTSTESFDSIQGGLLAPENFNYCKDNKIDFVNDTQIKNKFILLDARDGCYVDPEDLKPYIEKGALGAIMLVKPHNPNTRARDECNRYKPSDYFPMKVMLLYFSETEDYLNALKQSNVTVQVSSEISPGCSNSIWIPWSLISGLYSIVCAIYAAIKLRIFIKFRGFHIMSIPQLCLYSEIGSCLIHIILSIDPLNYGIFAPSGNVSFVAIPFHGLSLTLLAVNWDKAISKSNLSKTGKKFDYNKYQWAILSLWVIYLIFMIICVIFAAQKGRVDNSLIFVIGNGTTFVGAVGGTLYFSITGFRVVWTLRGAVLGTLQQQLWKMTRLIGFMTFIMLYLTVLSVFVVTKSVDPNSVLAQYSLQFGLITISFVQIASFVVPKTKGPSSEHDHELSGSRSTQSVLPSSTSTDMM